MLDHHQVALPPEQKPRVPRPRLRLLLLKKPLPKRLLLKRLLLRRQLPSRNPRPLPPRRLLRRPPRKLPKRPPRRLPRSLLLLKRARLRPLLERQRPEMPGGTLLRSTVPMVTGREDNIRYKNSLKGNLAC